MHRNRTISFLLLGVSLVLPACVSGSEEISVNTATVERDYSEVAGDGTVVTEPVNCDLDPATITPDCPEAPQQQQIVKAESETRPPDPEDRWPILWGGLIAIFVGGLLALKWRKARSSPRQDRSGGELMSSFLGRVRGLFRL